MSFTPTYLYVKQHTVTGKCYFGKTVKDPLKYLGSGRHWTAHLRVHGHQHVQTLWHQLFTDRDEIMQAAKRFSENQDIVHSTDWLNLVPETGVDGTTGMKGKHHSPSTKEKLAAQRIGRIVTPETRAKMASANRGNTFALGLKHTSETRAKMSLPKGARPRVECPHCQKVGGDTQMHRWHFENCKAQK